MLGHHQNAKYLKQLSQIEWEENENGLHPWPVVPSVVHLHGGMYQSQQLNCEMSNLCWNLQPSWEDSCLGLCWERYWDHSRKELDLFVLHTNWHTGNSWRCQCSAVQNANVLVRYVLDASLSRIYDLQDKICWQPWSVYQRSVHHCERTSSYAESTGIDASSVIPEARLYPNLGLQANHWMHPICQVLDHPHSNKSSCICCLRLPSDELGYAGELLT